MKNNKKYDGSWEVVGIEATNFLSFKSIKWKFQQTTFVVSGSFYSSDSNSGYLSNGSGKTSFIESIHTAIFGKSMTGRRISQCLRYGADKMTLDVHLKRTDGSDLNIYREVRDGKSSILKILLNGKHIDLQSNSDQPIGFVNPIDGNRWILNHIGLSADDVSSFYFVSPTTYKPFFNKTERERIQLFKRLANVSQIDVVSEDIKDLLGECKDAVASVDGELDGYNRDLLLLEGVLRDSTERFQVDISSAITNIRELITIEQKLWKTATADLARFNKELKVMPAPDESVNKEIKCFEDAREVLVKMYNETTGYINLAKSAIASLDVRKVKCDLNRQKILCPACKHEFDILSTLDKDELAKIREEEANINTERTCQSKFIESKQRLLDGVEEDLKNNKNKLKELNTQTSGNTQRFITKSVDVGNAQASIVAHERKLAELTTEFNQAKSERDLGYRGTEAAKIKNIKSSIGSVQKRLDIATTEYETARLAYNHVLAFTVQCCHRVIKVFCSLVNNYLATIDSGLKLRYTGVKTIKSGEDRIHTLPIITNDGVEVEYSSLSFGERARLNVCIELVIQGFINTNSSGGGLNIYVNDEAMAGCDANGIKKLYLLFEKIGKLIMFVTHTGNLDIERGIYIFNGDGYSVVKDKI